MLLAAHIVDDFRYYSCFFCTYCFAGIRGHAFIDLFYIDAGVNEKILHEAILQECLTSVPSEDCTPKNSEHSTDQLSPRNLKANQEPDEFEF